MFDKSKGTTTSELDKFSISRFIEFNNNINFYDPTTSILIEKIKLLPKSGEYILDKYRSTGRIDLISYEIYGTTKLWWVILFYNNIYSFYDVVVNTKLEYPSQSSVENLILSMKLTEGMWLK